MVGYNRGAAPWACQHLCDCSASRAYQNMKGGETSIEEREDICVTGVQKLTTRLHGHTGEALCRRPHIRPQEPAVQPQHLKACLEGLLIVCSSQWIAL